MRNTLTREKKRFNMVLILFDKGKLVEMRGRKATGLKENNGSRATEGENDFQA